LTRAFIEVSDTTYAEDRADKMPLYVKAGVPTWHVNVQARQVEFYAIGAELRSSQIFSERESIEILGVTIALTGLFRKR
jgi:uncharacterized protein YbcV (DUF1398 family)